MTCPGVQEGLGSAGVSIHSFLPYSTGKPNMGFISNWWKALGYLSPSQQTWLVPYQKWERYFTNGQSQTVQKRLYYDYVVPASSKVMRDLMTASAKVHYRRPRPPLLILAGSQDRVSSPASNYRSYTRYMTNHSITSYKEFEGFCHFPFGLPNWKLQADYVSSWLESFD